MIASQLGLQCPNRKCRRLIVWKNKNGHFVNEKGCVVCKTPESFAKYLPHLKEMRYGHCTQIIELLEGRK